MFPVVRHFAIYAGQIEDMNGRIVHILHACHGRFRYMGIERPECSPLLIAQALDGVELRRAPSGVVAEHQADQDGYRDGDARYAHAGRDLARVGRACRRARHGPVDGLSFGVAGISRGDPVRGARGPIRAWAVVTAAHMIACESKKDVQARPLTVGSPYRIRTGDLRLERAAS